MSLDYDAKAVAKVMGLDFVNKVHRPKIVPPKGRRGGGSPVVTRRRVSIGPADVGPAVAVHAEVPSDRFLAPSSVLIKRAVEDGLPRAALKHVAEALAGGDKSKVASLESSVVPKTTLERRRGKKLTPAESERTERIARLIVHATRALGAEAEAREFMTTPHAMLDGRSPFEEAKTDLGARRVERILNGLEYGLAL